MTEEKPKKKRKKKTAAEGEGGKDHKKNWREVNATPEEIKAFLSDHVYLRYNLVKYRVEARLPSEDPFWQNNELAQFMSDDWQPMSDRLKNTLLNAMRGIKPTGERRLHGCARLRLRTELPSVPALPEPSAAVGWSGPYHGAVAVGQCQGGRGEADDVCRVPETVARGNGGQLARRDGSEPGRAGVHRRTGGL